MGRGFCGFRCSSGRNRSSNQESRNGDGHRLMTAMMKFMKPRSLWGVRNRQQQRPTMEMQEVKVNVLTLEEWIMSSPALNSQANNSEGETLKASSRKIHPSFGGTLELSLPKSVEKTGEAEKGQVQLEISSSFGGKMRKRVSFRSPEVADIFVLDSPNPR